MKEHFLLEKKIIFRVSDYLEIESGKNEEVPRY